MKGLAASITAIGVNVVTGLAIGLLVVPSVVTGGAWRTITLVAVLGACAAALSPPVSCASSTSAHASSGVRPWSRR